MNAEMEISKKQWRSAGGSLLFSSLSLLQTQIFDVGTYFFGNLNEGPIVGMNAR